MIEEALLWVLASGVAAFLVASVTAPLATLSWWAGDDEDDEDDDASAETAPAPAPAPSPAPGARHYIVYLAGIHTIDGASHTPRERRFLDALAAASGEAKLVDTVFPYAVSGEPLVHSPRLFSQLWKALQSAPEATRRPLLANLINARNFFQVLVSADRRYGPIFNRAVAEHILSKLGEAGWAPGRGARITLFGYSGGAQIAAGAAERLSRVVDGPIDLISLGGVIAAPAGLAHLASVRHLTGRRDRAQRLGAAAFPGRWPLAAGSAWNMAVLSGRLERVDLGAMAHTGAAGYLGEAIAPGASRPNWETTLDAVRDLVSGP